MKQELSISFRADGNFPILQKRVEAVRQYPFAAISVYDDLGDPSPFADLEFFAENTHLPRLGPACLAVGKYPDLNPLIDKLDRLQQIRPEGVFLGLAPGAWMDQLNYKPATVERMREVTRVLNPQGKLPILIGGWGEKISALAGEIAQEIKIGGSANPQMVPLTKEKLAVGTSRVGRSLEEVGIVLGAVTVVDEDRSAAMALAKRKAVVYIDVIGQKDPTALRDYPEEMGIIHQALSEGNTEKAIANLPFGLARKFMIAGNSDDVISQVEEMFEEGASRVDFGSPHGINETEGIHLLGQKVLPYFKI